VAETRYQVPVTKYRQIVFAAKVAAVGIFAVGIEFFTNRNIPAALALWGIAVTLTLWPVRIDITDDAPPPEGADGKAGAKMHPLEEI
jgi:hypothetical protein